MNSVLEILDNHYLIVDEYRETVRRNRAYFSSYLNKYRYDICNRIGGTEYFRFDYPNFIGDDGDIELRLMYRSALSSGMDGYVTVKWREGSSSVVHFEGSAGTVLCESVATFSSPDADIVEWIRKVLAIDLGIVRRNLPRLSRMIGTEEQQ